MRASALVSATTTTLMGRVNDESRRAGSARFRTRVDAAAGSPALRREQRSFARAMAVPCACLQRPVGQIEKHHHHHLLVIIVINQSRPVSEAGRPLYHGQTTWRWEED